MRDRDLRLYKMGRNVQCVLLLFLFSTVFWKFLVNGYSDIAIGPVDTEVLVGDSAYLNCSIAEPGDGVSWYHSPADFKIRSSRNVYFEKKMSSPYDKRFRVERDISSGSFNLVIRNTKPQDAGVYVCQIDGTNVSTIAQLTVIESNPVCQSNFNQVILGQNSCGFVPLRIHVSCNIRYNGNTCPRLQLTRVQNGIHFGVDDSFFKCSSSKGQVTCKYTTPGHIKMDGSYFACHRGNLEDAPLKCSTTVVRIISAFTNIDTEEKTIGDNVTCFDDEYSGVCKNQWFYFNHVGEELVSVNQQLTLEHVGWYRCEAECGYRGTQCKVDMKLVRVKSNTTGPVAFCIVLVVSCAVLWDFLRHVRSTS